MADNHETAISVENLVKRINRKAILNGLSFRVDPAESMVILGPNGAGKTTLLRILATLMRPDSGDVQIKGHRLPEEAVIVRPLLGFVSHQPLLYGDLTARENLLFYSRLYGLTQAKKRIGDVLKLFGLESRSQDPVRTYSRGMQQRLAIGRAILHEPLVLLLDEPFTGLDLEASDMIRERLQQMRENGCTLVMTSHNPEKVEDTASSFYILDKGRFITILQEHEIPAEGLAVAYRQIIRQAAREQAF